MEKPDATPNCCGQPAKWVEQSINLAYFYCTKCKNEVTIGAEFSKAWDEVLDLEAGISWPGQGIPSGPKFSPGDRVVVNAKGYYHGKEGSVIRICPAKPHDTVLWYSIDFPGEPQVVAFSELELTAVALVQATSPVPTRVHPAVGDCYHRNLGLTRFTVVSVDVSARIANGEERGVIGVYSLSMSFDTLAERYTLVSPTTRP